MIRRTEKGGRRQRRLEAVKPVVGPAIIKAEHQEEGIAFQI